jgi:hypothetical protein
MPHNSSLITLFKSKDAFACWSKTKLLETWEENSLCGQAWYECLDNLRNGFGIAIPPGGVARVGKPKTLYFAMPIVCPGDLKNPGVPGDVGWSGSMGKPDNIKKIVDQIHGKHPEFPLQIIVGDEQTYETLWKIKRTNPEL